MSAGSKCVGVQLSGFFFDPVAAIPVTEIVSLMELLKGRPLSEMRLCKVRLSTSPELIRCDRNVINRFLRELNSKALPSMSPVASRARQCAHQIGTH